MKKRIGLLNIEHLKNRTSWTMGVAGVVRLLTWETKTTLGKSKTKFQKQIIKDVYNLSKNEDYTLNEIFFEDLEIRKPDYFLEAAGETSSETIGNILITFDTLLKKLQPDALLVLGDTNSCLSAYAAKRSKIPNITVCGKTGTSQNPHGDDHYIFIAFAPKENPKIAIAVYVEYGTWGSKWAAPIASLMMESFIKGSLSDKSIEKANKISQAVILNPKTDFK